MKKKHILAAIFLFALPVIAGAQVLKGSYFLDNSINRHKMNPAFAPRANYFQLPGLGYTGVGVYSNMDIPLLTAPVDGKLGTFLHPSVSVDDFKRNCPDHINLDADFETNILSFGWFNKRKGFWNFSIDTRVMVDTDLPSDLFVFLKQGVDAAGNSYNIGNINAYAMGGVQASLGYSREWMKGLRAGWKVRLIAPLAYAGLNLENVRLTTSTEAWNVKTEGYLHTAVQGLDMNLSEGSMTPEPDFQIDRMLSNKVIAGLGYSVDLGIQYTLEVGSAVDGLAFSAAVTDLGQIFYRRNGLSSFKTSGNVDWVGFKVNENGDVNVDEALDDIKKQAEGLLNLSEMEHPHKFERSTMPRFYAGVELPFLKRSMSIGLLYSARLSHSYVRQELTASYNLKPCKWFALGVNYSFLNTTRSMGAMLELTPKAGPCLYLGFDYFPIEWAHVPMLEDALGTAPEILKKIGFETWALPTSTRFSFNFGIAFNLGSKYVNPKKEKKNR